MRGRHLTRPNRIDATLGSWSRQIFLHKTLPRFEIGLYPDGPDARFDRIGLLGDENGQFNFDRRLQGQQPEKADYE